MILLLAIILITHSLVCASPCTGIPSGFVCVAGNPEKYYQCSSDFQGWRDCPTGTSCTQIGEHPSNPCSIVVGTTQSNPSTSVGESLSELSFFERKFKKKKKNPAAEGTNGISIHWALWLLIGVTAFLMFVLIFVCFQRWLSFRRCTRKQHKKSPSKNVIEAKIPAIIVEVN